MAQVLVKAGAWFGDYCLFMKRGMKSVRYTLVVAHSDVHYLEAPAGSRRRGAISPGVAGGAIRGGARSVRSQAPEASGGAIRGGRTLS